MAAHARSRPRPRPRPRPIRPMPLSGDHPAHLCRFGQDASVNDLLSDNKVRCRRSPTRPKPACANWRPLPAQAAFTSSLSLRPLQGMEDAVHQCMHVLTKKTGASSHGGSGRGASLATAPAWPGRLLDTPLVACCLLRRLQTPCAHAHVALRAAGGLRMALFKLVLEGLQVWSCTGCRPAAAVRAAPTPHARRAAEPIQNPPRHRSFSSSSSTTPSPPRAAATCGASKRSSGGLHPR